MTTSGPLWPLYTQPALKAPPRTGAEWTRAEDAAGAAKGAKSEIDLSQVLRRHLRIFGSTLRTRSVSEKAQIVSAFLARFDRDLDAASTARQITGHLDAEDRGLATSAKIARPRSLNEGRRKDLHSAN